MSRSEGRLNQYSSRGIGIPVGGAIGGGDDAQQRLGRPYVPKPFRSQGGFEGSADSNYSYKLGRHNVDDEGAPTFNLDNIASRKIAGPRALPRGFKMKKTPYNKMVDFEMVGDKAISSAAMQYEHNLNEFLDNLLNWKNVSAAKDYVSDLATNIGTAWRDIMDTPAGEATPGAINNQDVSSKFRSYGRPAAAAAALFGPAGFAEIGHATIAHEQGIAFDRAVASFSQKLEVMSGGEITDLDRQLFRDEGKVKNSLKRLGQDDLLEIYNDIKALIGMMQQYIVDSFKAIPFGLLGPLAAVFDKLIDTSLTVANYSNADRFFDLFMDNPDEVLGIIDALGLVFDVKDEKIQLSNMYVIGIEAERLLNDAETSLPLQESYEDSDEELDEFSGAGAIAGYTMPLGAGPTRKKDFYKKMAKPLGGFYMQDPAKIKPRP